jgi:hypothetical protein
MIMSFSLKSEKRQSVAPNSTGFLQRKCSLCHKKKRPIQRLTTVQGEPEVVPPIVYDVLRSPGQFLGESARAFFGPKFGHDFADVRVHSDVRAAESAKAINARAYTAGSDIVFGSGQFSTETSEGKRLLAHELTHVVQQGSTLASSYLTVEDSDSSSEEEARQASEGMASGRITDFRPKASPSRIQRENGDEDERRIPAPSQSPPSSSGGNYAWHGNVQRPWYQLHLDPRIGSQLDAIEYTSRILSTDSLRRSLLQIDFSTLQTAQPPSWLTTPSVPSAQPPVPRGAGPSEPRSGTAGDVLRGVMRIPAVDSALTRLQTEASSQARHVWSDLSLGGRIVLLTQTALIGGGALAGVLSNPEARQFAFQQLQGTNIPMPGIPGLTFQLNLAGPERSVMFNLNLGEMLHRP